MVLPVFRRGFFDVYWIDLAAASGSGRILQARFPHDNHGNRVEQSIIDADEAAYQHWRSGDIHGEVRKVRAVRDVAHFFPSDLILA